MSDHQEEPKEEETIRKLRLRNRAFALLGGKTAAKKTRAKAKAKKPRFKRTAFEKRAMKERKANVARRFKEAPVRTTLKFLMSAIPLKKRGLPKGFKRTN